jgi:3-oxoacyl-[acyl-carrier-protein] synthase II
MDRLSQMVLVASMEAINDSGIGDAIPAERLGVVIGNGYGGTSTTDAFIEGLLVNGPSGVNPMLFPTTVPNSAASNTSIMLGIKGPNSTFCQKDVSAEQAIIYAAELLRKGAADAIIAGGGEELSDVMYHAFDALWVLSPGYKGDPEDEGCRPFDKRRNGRVLGEGAGVLVLETLDSATSRGARIYAEITGWAQSSGNAGISEYDSDPAPIVRAMSGAMKDAGVGPEDIDCISASANSTPELDAAEAAAIVAALGRHSESVPVTTIRPMTGDFDGMGGLRLLTSVMSIKDGHILPILNLDDPGAGVALNFVTGAGLASDVGRVLHNGVANGGACASIILARFNG